MTDDCALSMIALADSRFDAVKIMRPTQKPKARRSRQLALVVIAAFASMAAECKDCGSFTESDALCGSKHTDAYVFPADYPPEIRAVGTGSTIEYDHWIRGMCVQSNEKDNALFFEMTMNQFVVDSRGEPHEIGDIVVEVEGKAYQSAVVAADSTPIGLNVTKPNYWTGYIDGIGLEQVNTGEVLASVIITTRVSPAEVRRYLPQNVTITANYHLRP